MGAAARFTLPEECTLRDAPALQAQLVALRSPADAVIVDAGAVRRIDTAALQLLVAFVRREQAEGRQVQWPAPSAEFLESSHRIGLGVALGLPAGGCP